MTTTATRPEAVDPNRAVYRHAANVTNQWHRDQLGRHLDEVLAFVAALTDGLTLGAPKGLQLHSGTRANLELLALVLRDERAKVASGDLWDGPDEIAALAEYCRTRDAELAAHPLFTATGDELALIRTRHA